MKVIVENKAQAGVANWLIVYEYDEDVSCADQLEMLVNREVENIQQIEKRDMEVEVLATSANIYCGSFMVTFNVCEIEKQN